MFCFFFVLYTLCCQFLWIVYVLSFLRLVYPMLPVSLDCSCFVFSSYCIPYVEGDYIYQLPLQKACISHAMNFTASNNIGVFHSTCCKQTLENTVQIIQNVQSRETGNIWYTRRRKNRTWMYMNGKCM
jgi:hypothetical protein